MIYIRERILYCGILLQQKMRHIFCYEPQGSRRQMLQGGIQINLNQNIVDKIQFLQEEREMSSGSERSPSRQRSRSKGKPEKHKLFVTDLDGTGNEAELRSQLEQLFSKYGKIKEVSVKKSRNAEYSFAFVEYEPGEDAEEAVKNLNGATVKGKAMKVEFQDNSKRRKDPDKGCYTCGKKGHFARECRSRGSAGGYRRSRDSRSSSDDRRKPRRRSRSRSDSERRKSKKDRKHSSKDKKDKKSKKSKKSSRYRSRSSSRSRS